MVRVRLSRAGSKKRPFYHIVVTDSQKARDGGFIDRLGIYDPSRPIAEARVDHERLDFWVGRGAQPSERVSKVVKEHERWLATRGDEAEGTATGADAKPASPAPAGQGEAAASSAAGADAPDATTAAATPADDASSDEAQAGA